MTRGLIDLGAHKLANVYRAPARKSRHRRARMEKTPDAVYAHLWRLVDGAVRDAFANHPEYLTKAGNRSAQSSVVKRVVGTLHGYATQVARGRSVAETPMPHSAACTRVEVAAAAWTGIDLSRAGPIWEEWLALLEGLCGTTRGLWRRLHGRLHEIQGWPK